MQKFVQNTLTHTHWDILPQEDSSAKKGWTNQNPIQLKVAEGFAHSYATKSSRSVVVTSLHRATLAHGLRELRTVAEATLRIIGNNKNRCPVIELHHRLYLLCHCQRGTPPVITCKIGHPKVNVFVAIPATNRVAVPIFAYQSFPLAGDTGTADLLGRETANRRG